MDKNHVNYLGIWKQVYWFLLVNICCVHYVFKTQKMISKLHIRFRDGRLIGAFLWWQNMFFRLSLRESTDFLLQSILQICCFIWIGCQVQIKVIFVLKCSIHCSVNIRITARKLYCWELKNCQFSSCQCLLSPP